MRFLGNVHFADGIWCGVELLKPLGKHDGSVEVRWLNRTHLWVCCPPSECARCIHKVSPLLDPRTPPAPWIPVNLQDKRYFSCPDGYGVFVSATQVKRIRKTNSK